MDFSGYVVGIVAVVVYMVCLVLHSIDFINNRWLPLVAAALGIIFNVWFCKGFGFHIFVGGLASGLSAVGIDQTIEFFITTFKDDEKENKDERDD